MSSNTGLTSYAKRDPDNIDEDDQGDKKDIERDLKKTEREVQKSKREIVLICALCSLCVANMMISNIAAVLPSYLDEKTDWVGPDIKLSSLEISYMVAIFSVAQMIATPLNSRGKNYFGAKNYIVIGWVVLTAATLGTGFTTYINNKVTFLVVTCLLRFLSGGSDTMI